MHVPIVRSLLIVLGLSLGSRLLAQQPQQEFPTYRQLKEEQRIILNAYLIRGENPYLLQAEAAYGRDNLGAAEQNALTAVLLLGRARERLNEHPTKIEIARNALGFRLGEDDREELRTSVRNEIDPRYFRLLAALQDWAKKFSAKGATAVGRALAEAQNGNSKAVERIIVEKGGTVERDVLPPSGGGGTTGGGGSTMGGGTTGGGGTMGGGTTGGGTYGGGTTGGGGTTTGGGTFGGGTTGGGTTGGGGTMGGGTTGGGGGTYGGGTTGGGGGASTPLSGLSGGSVTQTDPNTVSLVTGDGRTLQFPGRVEGNQLVTDAGRIDLGTIRRDAHGNIVGMSDNGPVYFKDGRWHRGLPPGTQPSGPATVNGQIVDDSDLSDGVLRRYIGGKGATLVSEQRISMAKNPDGTPKLDAAGKLTLDLGERRVWTFRINPGEQKTVDGRVQQTVTVVDGGGSTSFNITNWDVRSRDGRAASVQPSGNPGEATITFPGNGTYDITASGVTTGWEKGSPFKVKGEVGAAQ